MRKKYNSPQEYRDTIFAEKSETILKAAFVVFSEFGYKNASIARIAREGSVSPTTIYKHYKDKSALFSGVMSKVWSSITESINDIDHSLTVSEGLTQVANNYVEVLNQPKVKLLFKVIIAEVDEFPELGEMLYEKGKKPYLDALYHFIKEKKSAGELSVDNVKIAASQLLGMINDTLFWPSLLLPWLSQSKLEEAKVIDESVNTFLARYSN